MATEQQITSFKDDLLRAFEQRSGDITLEDAIMHTLDFARNLALQNTIDFEPLRVNAKADETSRELLEAIKDDDFSTFEAILDERPELINACAATFFDELDSNFQAACRLGRLKIVKHALTDTHISEVVNIYGRSGFGNDTLSAASRNGHEEIANLIRERHSSNSTPNESLPTVEGPN